MSEIHDCSTCTKKCPLTSLKDHDCVKLGPGGKKGIIHSYILYKGGKDCSSTMDKKGCMFKGTGLEGSKVGKWFEIKLGQYGINNKVLRVLYSRLQEKHGEDSVSIFKELDVAFGDLAKELEDRITKNTKEHNGE